MVTHPHPPPSLTWINVALPPSPLLELDCCSHPILPLPPPPKWRLLIGQTPSEACIKARPGHEQILLGDCMETRQHLLRGELFKGTEIFMEERETFSRTE